LQLLLLVAFWPDVWYTYGVKFNNKNVRQYFMGRTPCSNCQSSKHERCRPKLDGTLCTCTCSQAELTRIHVRWYMQEKEISEQTKLVVKQALKLIGKKYKPT
jgi:hypothetical protein